MSSDDDDLNKELLQVAGGRSTGSKRGRPAASASEEASLSEEVSWCILRTTRHAVGLKRIQLADFDCSQ